MDPATRAQVLRVRSDLKLDQYAASSKGVPFKESNLRSDTEYMDNYSSQVKQHDSVRPKNRTPSFSERTAQAGDANGMGHTTLPQGWAMDADASPKRI